MKPHPIRLLILTFILGGVLGFMVHLQLAAHPDWWRSKPQTKPVTPKLPAAATETVPTKPRVYMPVEKILTRLRQEYDEAVVVVLADESYDDEHKLIRAVVREVWKGPANLTDKPMNAPLGPPLSYLHGQGSVRVLKFIYMTPTLNSGVSFKFDGDKLGLNPAITASDLKAILTAESQPPEI